MVSGYAWLRPANPTYLLLDAACVGRLSPQGVSRHHRATFTNDESTMVSGYAWLRHANPTYILGC